MIRSKQPVDKKGEKICLGSMKNLHGGETRPTLGKEICESEETGNSNGYSIIHLLTLEFCISDKYQSNMIHFTA
jgi:hypothetical protein